MTAPASGPTRTRRSALKTGLLLCALLVSPSAVVAQSDHYQTEILDWNIRTTGPNYVIENSALEEYPHGRGERVYITSVDSLGFAEIAFFDDEDTPEQTIDIMLSDFEAASQSMTVIATGEQGGIHAALARFDLTDAISGYFYIEVAEDVDGNVDLAQSIYSLNADFLEQLAIASDELSMDGLAFLGTPIIDLESAIADDQAALAATPIAVATPERGERGFQTSESTIEVRDPLAYDFPYTNNDLDVWFLTSAHGYGVIGYVNQEADTADAVLEGVFVGAPTGADAPVELQIERGEDQALGIYRVQADGETRAMIIRVTRVSEGVWTVEAMAVTEADFAAEFQAYQSAVTFADAPMFEGLQSDSIVTILEES